MSNLSKESKTKILSVVRDVRDVTDDQLDEMVYTAYMSGDLNVVDKIHHNDEDFDAIFKVGDEMFKIALFRNSYGEVYSFERGIKGPLKPVEKTVTVYE